VMNFGEKPNAVLDLVADQAVLWTHTSPVTRIDLLIPFIDSARFFYGVSSYSL
jgi:hypothetical protein